MSDVTCILSQIEDGDPKAAEGAEMPAPDLALPDHAADHLRGNQGNEQNAGRERRRSHVKELLGPQDEHEAGG